MKWIYSWTKWCNHRPLADINLCCHSLMKCMMTSTQLQILNIGQNMPWIFMRPGPPLLITLIGCSESPWERGNVVPMALCEWLYLIVNVKILSYVMNAETSLAGHIRPPCLIVPGSWRVCPMINCKDRSQVGFKSGWLCWKLCFYARIEAELPLSGRSSVNLEFFR